jgi:hypothetical protein
MLRPSPLATVLLLGLGLASTARAEGTTLTAELLTDAPALVGARVAVELPHRLRGSLAVGVMPGPYVDLVNEVAIAIGGYDQATADLLKATLDSSLVLRTHVGWRPIEDWGLYFDVGYTLATLGGGLSGAEAIAAASGQMPPSDAQGTRAFDATSTLHLLDAEIGWRWWLDSGLTLRAALGFMGTVAASSSIRPDFTPRAPAVIESFTTAGEVYLDDVYTSYVFSPVITLAAGWRFSL